MFGKFSWFYDQFLGIDIYTEGIDKYTENLSKMTTVPLLSLHIWLQFSLSSKPPFTFSLVSHFHFYITTSIQLNIHMEPIESIFNDHSVKNETETWKVKKWRSMFLFSITCDD